jgi:hypothetical protein
LVLVNNQALVEFLLKVSTAGATVCGSLLALSSAAFFKLVGQSGTDFGRYMASEKANMVYLKAFGTSMAVTLSGLLAFVVAGQLEHSMVAHASGFLFLYAVLQFWSVIKNAYDFVWLRNQFDETHAKLERETAVTSEGGTAQSVTRKSSRSKSPRKKAKAEKDEMF